MNNDSRLSSLIVAIAVVVLGNLAPAIVCADSDGVNDRQAVAARKSVKGLVVGYFTVLWNVTKQ